MFGLHVNFVKHLLIHPLGFMDLHQHFVILFASTLLEYFHLNSFFMLVFYSIRLFTLLYIIYEIYVHIDT